jgi:hypothetical protein
VQNVLCEIKDKNLQACELSPSDWTVLKEMKSILMPFFQVTEVLEGDQYPTLSLVNLFYEGILEKLVAMATVKKRKTKCSIDVQICAEIERWKRDVHMDLRVDGPKGPKFTDPLDWWKNNKSSFPILASAARLVTLHIFQF